MSKTKKRILIGALLSVALVPAAILAAPRRPVNPMAGAYLERVAQRLELTTAQREEIKAILTAHAPELKVEIEAVVVARKALFTAIHAEPLSESAIRSAAAVVGRVETTLAVTRGRVVDEVREVLTAEQRAEFAEIVADAQALAASFGDRLRERLAAFLG